MVIGIVLAALGIGGSVKVHAGPLVVVGGFGAVMAIISLLVLIGFSFV